jgi:hypothetical protein
MDNCTRLGQGIVLWPMAEKRMERPDHEALSSQPGSAQSTYNALYIICDDFLDLPI